ncbi:MAG: SufE family protein [Marinilabiliales bacterium]|nr:SufE family protein [Marinilabiliales bacterium]
MARRLIWMKEKMLFSRPSSDGIITKGLIALLVRVFSGHSPRGNPTGRYWIFRSDWVKGKQLSPTRSNGSRTSRWIKQMKLYAVGYASKLKDNLYMKSPEITILERKNRISA